MGRKIFVSYKYADNCVKFLNNYKNTRVREYIDEFEKLVDASDDIYKGETDG